MSNTPARLLVVAAAVLFSTGGAAVKLEAFGVAQVSMLRSGIAALVLILFFRRAVAWTPAIAVIGLVYAMVLSLFVGATKLTTSANAIFLQASAPLYLLVLAPQVLGERFHRRDTLYLAAVAVGVVGCFLGQPAPTDTAPNPAMGNLLGAAAGFAWALTLLSLRYLQRPPASALRCAEPERREPRTRDLGVSAVIAGNVIACLAALPFALPLSRATAGDWATVAYLGTFQIGLAYVCLTAAMKRVPALDVSLLLLLEPVLNPIWTWLVRGEQPGGWTLVGGAVIVLATAIKVVRDSRRTAAANTAAAARRGA